jgi:hypothetical protein
MWHIGLEINEKPTKKAMLDLEKLSISNNSVDVQGNMFSFLLSSIGFGEVLNLIIFLRDKDFSYLFQEVQPRQDFFFQKCFRTVSISGQACVEPS